MHNPISLIMSLLPLTIATLIPMETLPTIPPGWHKIGSPSPSSTLHLRIAMTSPNHDLFEQTLYDVSDPSSERYGKHLTKSEVKHILRPTEEATAGVMDWLVRGGVSEEGIADDGEWIHFIVEVDVAEELLGTEFAVYENGRGERKVRTLGYSVPDALFGYIDMVQPTTRFGEVQPEGSRIFDVKVIGAAPYYEQGHYDQVNSPVGGHCNDNVTPACLRALYKLPSPETIDLNNGTSGFMAFANFLEQVPRYADLFEFQREYAPYAVGSGFSWEGIAGGDNNQASPEDSGEANLDSQYLQAMGWPVNMHSYNTAGRGPLIPDLSQPGESTNEPYLDLLNYLLAQPDEALPHTLAISYGESEQSVPLQFRKTVCSMFGQLGARGVSVLFASGDHGVGSSCQKNDGSRQTRFLAMFPAACPFVTSVGGTTDVNPEQAFSFSSGGFSDTWERPAYQDAAVGDFLQGLGSQWHGLFNRSGRGFPDVAAQYYQFHVIDKGNDTLISGTSAAAPVFAGIIALINAERLKAGKSTLGFLNPFIYSSGYKGLNDITVGRSQGCTGRDPISGLAAASVPGASWQAGPGWDPVTGFGTPNYERLLQLALESS